MKEELESQNLSEIEELKINFKKTEEKLKKSEKLIDEQKLEVIFFIYFFQFI